MREQKPVCGIVVRERETEALEMIKILLFCFGIVL